MQGLYNGWQCAILVLDEKKLPVGNQSANHIFKLRRDLSSKYPWIAHSSKNTNKTQIDASQASTINPGLRRRQN